MFRRIFIFAGSSSQFSEVERKSGVKTDSLFIHYSITAQLSGWNDCDVNLTISDGTRTEQIFTLAVVHALVQ